MSEKKSAVKKVVEAFKYYVPKLGGAFTAEEIKEKAEEIKNKLIKKK